MNDTKRELHTLKPLVEEAQAATKRVKALEDQLREIESKQPEVIAAAVGDPDWKPGGNESVQATATAADVEILKRKVEAAEDEERDAWRAIYRPFQRVNATINDPVKELAQRCGEAGHRLARATCGIHDAEVPGGKRALAGLGTLPAQAGERLTSALWRFRDFPRGSRDTALKEGDLISLRSWGEHLLESAAALAGQIDAAEEAVERSDRATEAVRSIFQEV